MGNFSIDRTRMGLSRRRLITAGASGALLGLAPFKPSYALKLKNIVSDAVNILPGAAEVLGGFDLVQLISNTNSLVKKTKKFEDHLDAVLVEVSSTLQTIQDFIKNCDRTLTEIAELIRHLPDEIERAFESVATKQALGRLDGHCANMTAYLQSRKSIASNHSRIQQLCEQIVGEISTIRALNPNEFEFVIQTVPALVTWMQGYTAFNLLLPPDARSKNPWEHDVVASVTLPKINNVIGSLEKQREDAAKSLSELPIFSGLLHTFSGNEFHRSKQRFAASYPAGTIDEGAYYTIWPENAVWKGREGSGFKEDFAGLPGDLCFLRAPAIPQGSRDWWPLDDLELSPEWKGVERSDRSDPRNREFFLFAKRIAFSASDARRGYAAELQKGMRQSAAVDGLTDGLEAFDQSVKANLIEADKTAWLEMPTLRA